MGEKGKQEENTLQQCLLISNRQAPIMHKCNACLEAREEKITSAGLVGYLAQMGFSGQQNVLKD